MWIPCFIPLYSPLNLYLSILWILDFKYILLLLLLLTILGHFVGCMNNVKVLGYFNYQHHTSQNSRCSIFSSVKLVS